MVDLGRAVKLETKTDMKTLTEKQAACIYCGAVLAPEAPSSRFDPDGGQAVRMSENEWIQEELYHNDGCEWVATRAHTLCIVRKTGNKN